MTRDVHFSIINHETRELILRVVTRHLPREGDVLSIPVLPETGARCDLWCVKEVHIQFYRHVNDAGGDRGYDTEYRVRVLRLYT